MARQRFPDENYGFEEEEDPYEWMMEPEQPSPWHEPAPMDPGPSTDFAPMLPGPSFTESPAPFDEGAWMDQPTKKDFGFPDYERAPDVGLYAPFDDNAYMDSTSSRKDERSPYGQWMDNEKDLSPRPGEPGYQPGPISAPPGTPLPRTAMPRPGSSFVGTPGMPKNPATVGIGQPPTTYPDQPPPPNAAAPIGPTPSGSVPGTGQEKLPSAASATTPGANATIGNGQNAYEGFNPVRTQNPKVSFKDAYFEALQQAPQAPGQDLTQLAAWFNQNIKPKVEAHGHKVNSVDGDKVNFTSPEGTFTMDYYHWDANPQGKRYATWMDSGSAQGGGTSGAGGASGNAAAMAGKAKSWEEAFAIARSTLSPNLPKDQMEAGLAAIFSHLPGYNGVYKESVRKGQGWHDLIDAYDPGKGGTWVGAFPGPKSEGHGSSSSASAFSGGGMGTSSVGGGGVSGMGAGVPGAAGVETSSMIPSYEELLRMIGRG